MPGRSPECFCKGCVSRRAAKRKWDAAHYADVLATHRQWSKDKRRRVKRQNQTTDAELDRKAIASMPWRQDHK